MSSKAGCSTRWDEECRFWAGMYFVSMEMSGLEPIDEGNVLTTIALDSEMFISLFDDWT